MRPGPADGLSGADAVRRLVLPDTSAWIACARFGDAVLESLLRERRLRGHGVVSGELALGCGATAARLAAAAAALPAAPELAHHEVQAVVERHGLSCRGLSWSDVSLLASVLSAEGASVPLAIYTLDRALAAEARRLGVLWN